MGHTVGDSIRGGQQDKQTRQLLGQSWACGVDPGVRHACKREEADHPSLALLGPHRGGLVFPTGLPLHG